jgi:CRP/FNR family transcriptional regulator
MNQRFQENMIKFFSNYPVIKYNSKEIIYRPQEMIDQIAFVKSGYVRIYSQNQEAEEITFSGFKPVFLMSYFFSQKNIPNQYFFQALTDVEIWKAPVSEFNKYLLNNSNDAIDLINLSLGSLHQVLLSWENSLRGDAYSRIAKLTLILAKDYGKTINNKITIDFHTTHQLIASMLGISRETASLQIKKMENNGLILQQANKIIINDAQKMIKEFAD